MRSAPLEAPPFSPVAVPGSGGGSLRREERGGVTRSAEAPRALERLAAELAVASAGFEGGGLDHQVGRALDELAAVLGTDQIELLEGTHAGGGGLVWRSWSRGRSALAPERGETRGALPWYYEALRRGEVVKLEEGDVTPPRDVRGADERAGGGARRVRWLFPVSVRGRRLCALAAGGVPMSSAWSEATRDWLRVVGAILASALDRGQLATELRRARGEVHRLQGHLEAESAYLREEMDLEAGFETLIGRSAALRQVIEQAAQVAPTAVSVLLLGETGTGKELLARAIHARSGRHARPLVKVNCAALPPSLVESELFGHERGAFTGATSTRPGRFELAEGGTLLLDEIGEVPPDVQVKLLRVLQDGEFERVGGTRTRKAHVRVIAATNRDLERAIAEGRFREDLYYRLSAFPIRVPPLRERCEDIPLLVWNCIQQRQDELGRRIERVSGAAMRALVDYAWPGNVRELGNVIERALILSRGPVLELDAAFGGAGRNPGPESQRLADVERTHILRVLEQCAWRINGRGNAAETLGLHPNTLRSRMKKLGVVRPAGSGGVAAGADSRGRPRGEVARSRRQPTHEIA